MADCCLEFKAQYWRRRWRRREEEEDGEEGGADLVLPRPTYLHVVFSVATCEIVHCSVSVA